MLHEKDRLSQCGAFTVLVFHTVVFLTLIHSCRGQSEVIGPSQPIVAFIGEDIILPCHLEPAMNAFDITVEWARSDLDPRFVLVWRDGVELESKKHPSYRGRTSLFTEELKHGNVSLKLSKVKISDEGTYRCLIPVLARTSTVQLVVGAVSPPVIQSSKNLSAVVLQCESEGWYPEPEVLWLDGEGNLLPAGPTETLRGPEGLYTVSSRVAVEKRHGNSFTCRVNQQHINQTRETHVHVPDEFFMVPSTPSTAGSPGVITGSVIGCALLLLIAALVFVVWKWRQKKFKNKRRSLEDGAEHTEEEKKVTSKGDNTGVQVLMEREGESAPLMAGREEENNGMRAEDEDGSQSEHKDETQQNQLETKPDMDRAEGERDVTSRKNENVPLIATEVEKHQKQDMTGREVKDDGDQGEGEQTMKPVEEDSGRSLVLLAEGPKERLQNVLADQEEEKEEETRQEPMTEGKPESQKLQISEKAEQREIKRGQSKNELTSVSTSEVTEKPDLKTHQETAGRQNQELREENQLQTENQQPNTKEQPEESSQGVKVELKETGKGGMKSDEGANIDETQKTSKKIQREGQLQAEQHLDVKEGIPEKREVFMFTAERGGECQGVQQQELIENNRRPKLKARRRGKQHKPEEESNEAEQQTVCRKRRQEEDSEQTQESSRKLKEQNGDERKCEDEANKVQDVEMEDVSYQQDQAFMCQESQQEEDMDL